MKGIWLNLENLRTLVKFWPLGITMGSALNVMPRTKGRDKGKGIEHSATSAQVISTTKPSMPVVLRPWQPAGWLSGAWSTIYHSPAGRSGLHCRGTSRAGSTSVCPHNLGLILVGAVGR